MSSRPLLVFDFDGVLVDGMAEYWWSSRRAALGLDPSLVLPEQAPVGFARLRPLIHKGWEMVLVAAELARPGADPAAIEADYAGALSAALARSGWQPSLLQAALEEVRRGAIASDRGRWLALHRAYPGVPERLLALSGEGADWAVLTTKGAAFARELLAALQLSPWRLYGHEQGSKAEVLLQLRGLGRPLWFIEDRRPTLETILSTPGLEQVRCFLAAWGYLGPGDRTALPPGIALLEPDRFAGPLAIWP
ncbi:HAD family hydrolase [Synechococcus sp. CS-602]|uniref:HAD family hydrolase n=1 Tax=Synechococcaceae TaxID=1890426 RepID=UPI0008FF664A|nr:MULTISPECIES: HAD family hydrolase [Synechococcaceae]MCT4364397.1 HAD family hydrolase [Candidatus Regnicoccus frigidus MAG-AL1]APD48307.1 HAD family hydrolase [Synechococcus sp. SynAce01]MCT0201529.1 HAD family hydrolase [Synechococcus sp. CS-603]MCT0206036.1 HAD family hydrolase [Synechococcus sp. CS-602]MCT0244960.1 HAD family hydrolase [Synechococcus sp. CS-601]